MKYANISWVSHAEKLADAVLQYRDDREALIDILAYSLEERALNLPLVESGKTLDDLCPFTFLASMYRELSPHRRATFIETLSAELDISGSMPTSFDGLIEIGDNLIRFVSNRSSQQHVERETLWDLFHAAIMLADNDSQTHRAQFIELYDRVFSLRIAGRHVMPIALSWIRPHFFPYYEGISDAFSGQEYLEMLDAVCGQNSDAFEITRSYWETIQSPPLSIDESLLASELTSCIDFTYAENVAHATREFHKHWNPTSTNFAEMCESAFTPVISFIPMTYNFNPVKELLIFAEKESQTICSAFTLLFNENALLAERILKFEALTAQLFERYRGDIVRATPRRSSHGNFHAISIYLFLKYPERYYLYSPRRLKALNEATAYGAKYRIADVESVERYYELCDQVVASDPFRRHIQSRPEPPSVLMEAFTAQLLK